MTIKTMTGDWATQAAALIGQGRIAEARMIAESRAARVPGDVEALRMAGRIALHMNDAPTAVARLSAASRLSPSAPGLQYELGVAHLADQNPQNAAACFRRHASVNPNDADCAFNWACALRRQGDNPAAAEHFAHALRLHPNWGEAAFNLGNALAECGRLSDALEAYKTAQKSPATALAARTNAAYLLLRMGEPEAAETAVRAVLTAAPDYGPAAALLGNVLTGQGRAEEALPIFLRARAAAPNDAGLAVNHALSLRALGRLNAALSILQSTAAAAPTLTEAHKALGAVLLDLHRLEDAEAAFRRALDIAPDDAESWNNLGNTAAARGFVDEALDHCRRAMAAEPDNAAIISNYLFHLTHSGSHPKSEIVAEHRACAARIEDCPTLNAVAPLPAPGEKIRIGYVSPDFRDHAVTFWFEPVLDHHDRNSFEIFAYHSGKRRDLVTERLRGKVDHWRSIAGLSPDKAAGLIAADGIHILIDLAGHSADNALPVFARKPAAVQAAWIGYPATTGLSRMDYRLAQADSEPDSEQEYFTETLVRMKRPPVFRPPADAPQPSPPPFEHNGFITFGSLNKSQKISDEALRLWADILADTPGSRLLMVLPDGNCDLGRAAFRRRTDAAGIPADRLDFAAPRPLRAFLDLIGQIDVALDPFPYGGGTTSLFTAWMGVPIVGMFGQGPAGGVTTGVMGSMHLHDFIARSRQEYRRIAAAAAAAPQRLAQLRGQMRGLMTQSINREEAELVSELEAVYKSWATAKN